jgi:hypothetical protein
LNSLSSQDLDSYLKDIEGNKNFAPRFRWPFPKFVSLRSWRTGLIHIT